MSSERELGADRLPRRGRGMLMRDVCELLESMSLRPEPTPLGVLLPVMPTRRHGPVGPIGAERARIEGGSGIAGMGRLWCLQVLPAGYRTPLMGSKRMLRRYVNEWLRSLKG